jgi:glyoxylase-like metal-dependent hydrolase (beta-lactamase superfamily II)
VARLAPPYDPHVVSHVTASSAEVLETLPDWATLVRAPNPGPMTLDGTNTWVLRALGARGCVVVDPGPLDRAHLSSIAAKGPVSAILVTHGHDDHTEGVPRLVELTGAPLSPAEDSAVAAAEAGLLIRPIATPGHTADSVCFLVSRPDGTSPGLLTGDTVLGRGTTVVAWPDGHLADYLDSLRRIADLGAGIPVLPGHGPALTDSATAAAFYLRHREARLAQVRAALDAGDSTAEEVVARVYADVDRSLWWAAEWSVRAQLTYLRRESQRPVPELDEP